jgi:homogentisate solanesyltransferase
MSTLEPEADETGTIINTGVGGQLKRASKIMYRFSRPHTIKGTILASVMSVLRAIRENPSALTQQSLGPLFARAVTGLFALLCGNAYIVGINQIYDVKIDEINKPFLPIAAKQLSEQRAWHVVLGCLAMGMVIVKKCFSPLIANLYVLGAVLGTIYSVPPLQFKRFPVLAGGIIAIVRGFLLNFGVYCAVREALQVPLTWNPVVGFISTFMTVFATVIAITKDLPDVEGDIRYNIGTFASKYGVKRVAGLATGVLSMAYVAAVALPFLPATSTAFNTAPMVGGHLLGLAYNLGIFRDFAASSGRITDAKAYYRKVWNMFYFEYLLYLLI